jgi:ABC-type arginine transport system ATPase subunit
MYRFLVIPGYPALLLGWDIMGKLGMVLQLYNSWVLLMFQENSLKAHKINLGLEQ